MVNIKTILSIFRLDHVNTNCHGPYITWVPRERSPLSPLTNGFVHPDFKTSVIAPKTGQCYLEIVVVAYFFVL